MLFVSEIFSSIQGEGPCAGQPAVFLRLAFCNLACTWCDSRYTWDWSSYDIAKEVHRMALEEVEARIRSFGIHHLVVTGGEPLLQARRLECLLRGLQGYYIELETNGTIPPSQGLLALVDQWNVSPKLENSGNVLQARLKWRALRAFSPLPNSFFKFVVQRPSDLREVDELVEALRIPPERVLLMPEGVDAEVLLERSAWLSEEAAKRGYRLSPRLHILRWGNVRAR
jgi:7-carboxy-7-deazaguanine synthase